MFSKNKDLVCINYLLSSFILLILTLKKPQYHALYLLRRQPNLHKHVFFIFTITFCCIEINDLSMSESLAISLGHEWNILQSRLFL